MSPTHGSNGDFLRRKLEDETTASEEEGGEGFSGWTRGQDTTGWAQPQEEVSDASQDGESRQQVAPKLMNFDLEEVCLEVSGHCCTGDTDAESREGVERRNIAWGLGNGFL